MQIAAAGDRALLLTIPNATSGRLRAAAERAREIPGVVAAIAGHESIYVIGTSDADALRRVAEEAVESRSKTASRHEVRVSFADDDGLDLREFLSHVNVGREQFLERVSSLRLSVRYLGFRAGFAYLDGWPREWRMPRRPTSRNRVPRGSFGIAGEMAGFYPIDSPGGWNILGRTDARLWDPHREQPNLFAPGDEVVVSEGMRDESGGMKAPRIPHPASLIPIAHVVFPGQLTTIIGPPDWSRVEHGLAEGGPFDEEAAAIANAAVGNPPDAPLLECVLVGPKIETDRRVAFCDGDLAVRHTNDVGRIRGVRGYLAIEGGIDEARLRYAEEPTVVKKGDSLFAPLIRPPGTFSPGRRTLRTEILIKLGPHDAPPMPEEWEVTPQMNRIGIRLRPLQPVKVKLPADLPSLGAQFGTLQWHADGTLMALGPDHPVTGGYLQPATVLSSERWKLAQLAPGDRIRLVAV
jgi:KipI family sensor histidine kinase inhibitor